MGAVEPILPQMVLVPAGEFIYGVSPASLPLPHRWDLPGQRIYCATFSISMVELTSTEFRRFVLDHGYDSPAYWSEAGNHYRAHYALRLENRFLDIQDACSGVSYYEAEAYCCWLAMKTGEPFRLPTEIEWEKAARGDDGRLYPWGNAWNPLACNWGDDTDGDREPAGKIDQYRYVAPVGTYPQGSSPYGCQDMAGNVAEWCADAIGTSQGRVYRVLRGGHYLMMNPAHLIITFRGGMLPNLTEVYNGTTGFRLARSEP